MACIPSCSQPSLSFNPKLSTRCHSECSPCRYVPLSPSFRSLGLTGNIPQELLRDRHQLGRYKAGRNLVSRKAAEQLHSQAADVYTPGPLDDIFLKIFRSKMAQELGSGGSLSLPYIMEWMVPYFAIDSHKEVGWDSSKPGYDGLVDIAKRLLVQYRTGEETERATVRVLRSLFPSWLLPLFKKLVAPLGDGKPAALLCAQVTLATCQWLMGRCTINEVEFLDGSKVASGVLVQKCKYLDETKCAGICIHTCKLPTQAFMNEDMGVLLTMEPNYEDFSCQFKFGVKPLPAEDDPALKTPCLTVCPTAESRASIRKVPIESQCPQVTANL